jgi:hypothetical protein
MKTWWAIALTAVVSLLAVGVLFLVSRQPRGEGIRLVPPPSPQPLVVHVSGAVLNPGLYQLPPGSRVQDAIQAAGGLLPEADAVALNLAALIKDGQRVPVPTILQAQATAAIQHRQAWWISTAPRRKPWKACPVSGQCWRYASSITGKPTDPLQRWKTCKRWRV